MEEIGQPIRNTQWICGDNNQFAKFVLNNRLLQKKQKEVHFEEEKKSEFDTISPIDSKSSEESDYGNNDVGFVI